ncbi:MULTISPECIES: hypothetical protein [Shewanella]|uniref:hypothetical protein n=1 Tax=Shewanella TaxID=22 RepID=UPI00048BC4E7|nr:MULTISPECIES: hypothetical protein [Shewanella]QLE84614.1 hypothetical protein FLM48_05605 [Shewanella sp. Scap07]
MLSTSSGNAVINDLSLGHLLYGLMAAFPVFFLPPLLSLVINYGQKPALMDEVLYTHIRWQRWSIVATLAMLAVSYIVPLVWLSIAMAAVAMLWYCHRVLKGWLLLVEGKRV